ncbi:MAG TPA: LppX_LprAFG lipoprotein [Solirubrobacteraceae bacterium]|jgi:hypothetical protein|nr:LppX_LprAFG lipoprotein [Solirubrobacteraceae bacterium]
MRHLATLLTACLLAVPALAGCGAEDVDPAALAHAADATSRQGGMHMTGTGRVETGGKSVSMTFEGDVDVANRAVRMTFEATAEGQDVSGEQVMKDTTLYMRMDAFEQAFGTEWVKMDLEAVGEEAGLDFGALQQLGAQNPADQLAWLRATSELERVGEEKLDGVETTHYKARIDVRRVPQVAPAGERAAVQRAIDRMVELTGTTTIPTEVWVDGRDLVRRQRLTMKQTKPAESTTTLDMRFSDYGKRVTIEAPEGEVKDLTELLKKELGRQSP